MIYLSIIIPLYNEEKRLAGLEQVRSFLKLQKFSSEIIVVNDGSTDSTLKLLQVLQKKLGLTIVDYKLNRGKGYAIKTGMLSASGSYRLFMDVDLSTPIQEFEKFKQYIAEFDVVIGSRKVPQANLIRRQNLVRETFGKAFTLLSQVVLGMGVSDFTCGFKCFSAKAADDIFTGSKIERWGFD